MSCNSEFFERDATEGESADLCMLEKKSWRGAFAFADDGGVVAVDFAGVSLMMGVMGGGRCG